MPFRLHYFWYGLALAVLALALELFGARDTGSVSEWRGVLWTLAPLAVLAGLGLDYFTRSKTKPPSEPQP